MSDQPTTAAAAPDTPARPTLDVSHATFQRGLPAGQFHVIVDPNKARRYVKRRLLLSFILLPVAGIGAALALSGYSLAGLVLVVLAVAANRIIHAQAPKILLHLAQTDARIYREAIDFEILEVQQAR